MFEFTERSVFPRSPRPRDLSVPHKLPNFVAELHSIFGGHRPPLQRSVAVFAARNDSALWGLAFIHSMWIGPSNAHGQRDELLRVLDKTATWESLLSVLIIRADLYCSHMP